MQLDALDLIALGWYVPSGQRCGITFWPGQYVPGGQGISWLLDDRGGQ